MPKKPTRSPKERLEFYERRTTAGFLGVQRSVAKSASICGLTRTTVRYWRKKMLNHEELSPHGGKRYEIRSFIPCLKFFEIILTLYFLQNEKILQARGRTNKNSSLASSPNRPHPVHSRVQRAS